MEYINFTVALPVSTYIKIEGMAKEKNVSKNQILLEIIFRFFTNRDKSFKDK